MFHFFFWVDFLPLLDGLPDNLDLRGQAAFRIDVDKALRKDSEVLAVSPTVPD